MPKEGFEHRCEKKGTRKLRRPGFLAELCEMPRGAQGLDADVGWLALSCGLSIWEEIGS